MPPIGTRSAGTDWPALPPSAIGSGVSLLHLTGGVPFGPASTAATFGTGPTGRANGMSASATAAGV